MKQLTQFAAYAIAALSVVACSSEDSAQQDNAKQNTTKGVATFDGSQPSNDTRALTRTTATYTLGGDAKVFWTSTDKIFVQDDANTFHQSGAANLYNPSNKAKAIFSLASGSFTLNNREVRYTGENGTDANTVTIATTQTQTTANDFSHLGTSGDCGTATATNTTVSSLASNGAYMVVAPGTYNFTITYTIKDPTTNVEGDIVKTISGYNCQEGKINDITAWIDKDIRDYSNRKYYMWDAKKDCWYGYESVQPSVILTTNPNYPKTATDIRWYNPTAGNATNSSAICHNINELIWYTMKGDPHWDGTSLWSLKGHLHIGGMWLLKHSAITGFSTEKYGTKDYCLETNGANVRINNTNVTAGKPANTTNYFYTPATGYYDRTDGTYRGSGDNPLYVQGYVWSSTTSLDQNGSGSYSLAYYMAFGSGGIYTNFMWKSTGFPNSLDD